MPLRPRPAQLLFALPLLLWLGPSPESRAAVNVFRDRAAFNAAAQNLSTIDFEGAPQPTSSLEYFLDGVRFGNVFGGLSVDRFFNPNSNTLSARGVGEISQLVIELPPGTTAVGCDQFSRVAVVTVEGGSTTMTASDTSDFVGFTSDAPISRLVIVIDVPEPAAPVIIDNLSFGQRRADGVEPVPLLFVSQATGRAAALDSVAQTPEPFRVETADNLSADGRTRLALFLAGVRLAAGDESQVTVRLSDPQQHFFELRPESVGRVRNLSWLSQLNVLLPLDLAPGDVTVTVNVRGVASNTALLRIELPTN